MEFVNYTAINKNYLDQDFKNMIIKNSDNSLTNKLYLKITDNVSASGNLSIQLIYEVLQDRGF